MPAIKQAKRLPTLDVREIADWKLVILRTEKAVLRPLMPCDITRVYVKGLNDPCVNKYMDSHKYSYVGTWNYVTEHCLRSDQIFFGIYSPVLVGTLRLHDIVPQTSAIMGICIFDKRYWKGGLATSSIKRVVDFVDTDLRLNEINAGIKQGNLGSCKAFERAGFGRIQDNDDGDHRYRWTRKG